MPEINEYKCDNCDLKFPTGWGGCAYVIDAEGNRITCGHPGELRQATQMIGMISVATLWSKVPVLSKLLPKVKFLPPSEKLVKSRMGFHSDSICIDCLQQFQIDIGNEENAPESWRGYYEAFQKRDERKCPYCASINVKTLCELIDSTCPKCKKGTIVKIATSCKC
jgi:hypothetical protein